MFTPMSKEDVRIFLNQCLVEIASRCKLSDAALYSNSELEDYIKKQDGVWELFQKFKDAYEKWADYCRTNETEIAQKYMPIMRTA